MEVIMSAIDMTPIQPKERISELDIVRGLALFGILMVNMSFFKYPVFFDRYPTSFPPGSDQFFAWVIQIFFTGKFYAIFSFLFGLGFYIFMERAEAKGLDLVPLYKRRLLALLAFGSIHLFLLWSGDILFTYAIVGFLLLKFRNKSNDSIRKWIISLFVVSFILNFLFGLISGVGELFAGDKYAFMMKDMIYGAIPVYLEGSLTELIGFRLINEVPYVFIGLISWVPAVLAFFLCGFYVGRSGIIRDIPGNIPLLRRVRNYGLSVGFTIMLFYVLIESGVLPVGILLRPALLGATNYAASIFIFPAYVSLAVLAAQTDFGKKILTPVAAAGRMALTNYLTQTIICITIFYGFGFGLYGSVSATLGVLIVVTIYLLQVVWSNLWFRKFRFGPMEWVWRTLTYKRREPFIK
jgi:uncharacterized protein